MSFILLGVLNSQAAGGAAAETYYDLLQTEVLDSASSSVVFGSLGDYSTDYQHFQLRMAVRSNRSALSDSAHIQLNGDTGTNYFWHALRGNGTSPESYSALSNSSMQAGLIPGNTNVTYNFEALVTDILDPFESKKATIKTHWGMFGSGENFVGLFSGFWNNTSSLTSITVLCLNGSFLAGSRISLYGLRKAA